MSASRFLRAFLWLLPFLYLIQVVLFRNDFVPLPYLALLGVLLAVFVQKAPAASELRGASSLDLLVGAFVLLNLPWIVYEWVATGFLDGVRVAIFFVVPPLIYFLVGRYTPRQEQPRFAVILAWTAMLVGGELFYEKYYNFILESTSPFQIRNYDYVAQVGSRTELPQLANIAYRVPGILEHLHATATYLGLGAVASLHLVLLKRRRRDLLLFAANMLTLIVSGGRTALVSTLVALFVYVRLHRRRAVLEPRTRKRRRRIGLVAAFVSIAGLTIGFAYEPLRPIYLGLFDGNLINPGTSFVDVVRVEIGIWVKAVAQVPQAIPLGLGPGPNSLRTKMGMSSDDFFPVDILGRYGLIGFTLFYGIFVVFIIEAMGRLRRRSLSSDDGLAIGFAVAIAVLLILTTVHSGALVRKAIYPWLFVAYGLGRRHFSSAAATATLFPSPLTDDSQAASLPEARAYHVS